MEIKLTDKQKKSKEYQRFKHINKMNRGYIKNYRKMLEWRWFQTPHVAHLFHYLLMKANYSDTDWHEITIHRGQLVTSRKTMAAETGLTENVIRESLKKLEKTGEISIKTTNKYSIITIFKYSDYQNGTSNNNQQITSKSPANHQQITTNKKEKEKKIKEVGTNVPSSSPVATTDKDINLLAFLEFFNKTMQEHGAQIPTITQISGKRKQALLARFKEHGKEKLRTAVINAATSPFLNGASEKPFVASFDWIFRPNNFVKVLEGNYNHDVLTTNSNGHGTSQQLTAQQRIEKSLEEGAEYYAGLVARNETSVRDGVPTKVW